MFTTTAYSVQSLLTPATDLASFQFAWAAEIMKCQADFLRGTIFEPHMRQLSAFNEASAHALKTYDRRPFNIKTVRIGNGVSRLHEVREDIIADKPFMRAINFAVLDEKHNPIERDVPKVLLIAPMSGHFSTLLRGTVEALLPFADVTITDWKNARNVPPSAGEFDLGTYQQYLIEMMQFMGHDTHAVGVCQPTVPLLAAVAQMAEDNDDNQPLSMTLMGGPIHPSANITGPVKLAKDHSIYDFKRVTGFVPFPHDGALRRVYPGFLQLQGFMAMNLDRHYKSHRDYLNHLMGGDNDFVAKHRDFYDEYMAVMDMTAEFYLETIEKVFQREDLPHGTLELNGRLIDPSYITNTALMTIEGGLDDIAGKGQTVAAHALCSNLPEDMKFAHLEQQAGHYGIFNGSKFNQNIVPRMIGFMHDAAARRDMQYAASATAKPPESWSQVQKREYSNVQPVADHKLAA